MTTFRRGEVDGRGLRLRFVDTGGPGFPVLFLHGVMGRGISWQGVMAGLGPRYRCIALDQRGHGRSDKPEGPYDREAYVADLEEAVEGLGLARFALVGHSTGALNAWVYAARHPERVAALVIEDMHASHQGGNYLEHWAEWLHAWPSPFPSQESIRTFFSGIRPSLGGYFSESFSECEDGWRPIFSREAVLRTLEGNEAKSWWEELSKVACPTLLLKGESSEEMNLEEAERMRSLLPQGRLEILAGAGHTIHVDQPEAYLERLSGFLGECMEGASASV